MNPSPITRGDVLREVLSEDGILDNFTKFMTKTLETLKSLTSNDETQIDPDKIKTFRS